MQTARNNKIKLDIDELTIILIEHDKRLSRLENFKAIAAKIEK